MKVPVKDAQEGMPKFVTKVLESKAVESEVSEIITEESDQINENTFGVIKIRQLEQKQELLVGLTDLLLKKLEESHSTQKDSKLEESHSTQKDSKLEESHSTQKDSKFEFTDISWYKKLIDT